jgi:hypothetical protein
VSALREIAAVVGIDVDSKGVDGLMGLLDKAKGTLGALAGAFAIHEIAEFIKGQAEVAHEIEKTSERLGVATDDLQRFRYAVELTGGEAENADRALFFLTKAIGEAGTAGGPNPFAAIKLALKDTNGHAKTALEVLPDLADKIAEAKTPAEQTAIAVSVFGKSALAVLPILRRGREGIKELSDEFDDLGGALSEEFVKKGAEAAAEMKRFDFVSRGLKSELAGGLMPSVVKLFSWFISLAAEARELAKNTDVLTTAGIALGAVTTIKLVPALLSSAKALFLVKMELLGIEAPAIAVVAAVGLLFLAFDDLWTLMHGGKSVIGDLLDKFGEVGAKEKFVQTLKDAWVSIKETWAEAKEIITSLFADMGKGAKVDGATVKGFFEDVQDEITASVTALASFVELMKQIKTGDFESIKNATDDLLQATDALDDPSVYRKARKERGQFVHDKEVERDLTGPTDVREVRAPRTVPMPGSSHGLAAISGDTTVGKIENNTTINVEAGVAQTPEQAMRATREGVSDAARQAHHNAIRALTTGGA